MIDVVDEPAAHSIPRPIHRFTRENAREMQARGTATRRAQKESAQKAQEMLIVNEADFRSTEIARTRAQIVMMHDRIDRCKESKELQFLTQALKNLHDIESRLRTPSKSDPSAGKPRSGSLAPLD